MALLTKRDPQIVVIDNTRTEHVHHTATVHEHRAPTDASVALLKEMEAAAEKKLIESVHVGNTAFECVIHTANDYLSDCVVMRAVFKLNGQQETVDHKWRPSGSDHLDGGKVEAMAVLRDKIANVIATKMINDALSRSR